MSDLTGFSSKAKSSDKRRIETARSGSAVHTYTGAELPPGYDPNVWHLTGVFYSEAEDYELSYHRFPIYGQLLPRLKDSGLMDQDASTEEELENLFQFIRWYYRTRKAKPLYEVADRELSGPKWRRFVEIMLVVFWADANSYTNFGDDNPLETFASKEGFIRVLDDTLSLLVTSKDYRKVEFN